MAGFSGELSVVLFAVFSLGLSAGFSAGFGVPGPADGATGGAAGAAGADATVTGGGVVDRVGLLAAAFVGAIAVDDVVDDAVEVVAGDVVEDVVDEAGRFEGEGSGPSAAIGGMAGVGTGPREMAGD